MSVVGCLLDRNGPRNRSGHDHEELGMMHDGWCPDCDLRSVVIDSDDTADGHAWATCTECGAGWVHRDELPGAQPVVTAERRAA
jgi:transcription elongation factor Elf1